MLHDEWIMLLEKLHLFLSNMFLVFCHEKTETIAVLSSGNLFENKNELGAVPIQ